MKKIGLLVVLMLTFVSSNIFAQTRTHQNHRQNERRIERRVEREHPFNRRFERREDFITYTTNEYRYVRVGRQVYKEIYRTTYTRNGMVVNRVLVDREIVERDTNRRMRFNVFLRF